MISQELLDELKTIIKEDYGILLEPQELLEVAMTLLGFAELLAKMDFESTEGATNG